MRFDILTIFPEIFDSPFSHSIIKRVRVKNIVQINVHDLRDWSSDTAKTVDDYIYGGGPGMLFKPEPLANSIKELKDVKYTNEKVVYLTPQGKVFNQKIAKDLSKCDHIILIAGRYEGVDERVMDKFVDIELSIGDFILTGGEIPAMVIVEAVTRLLRGALGNDESNRIESFEGGLLEPPQYTRPNSFMEMDVPPVLLSGNHDEINKWRISNSIDRTLQRRPDLLFNGSFDYNPSLMCEIKKRINLYIGILHHDIYDRNENIITTAIVNQTIHDLSRVALMYGAKRVIFITPHSDQIELGKKIVNYWMDEEESRFIEKRKESISLVDFLESFDQIKEFLNEPRLTIVVTSAKKNEKTISFTELQSIVFTKPTLLLFGTGWGISKNIIDRCDFTLKALTSLGDFNSLSVRSACSIILDRLLGTGRE